MDNLQIGRLREERGFTLIELLVVILIIGILAAIAIPSLLSQKSKAYDSSAQTLAQTAQTTAETYAVEHNGEYSFKKPKELKAIEPSINESSTNGEAYLSTAKGKGTGDDEYEVMVKAASTGDEYSVIRKSTGVVEHKCKSTVKGCPGHSEKSTSW